MLQLASLEFATSCAIQADAHAVENDQQAWNLKALIKKLDT